MIFAPGQAVDFQLVWNLLLFKNFADSQTDVYLNQNVGAMVPRAAPIIIDYGGPGQPGVQVTQFGSISSGYWVMVTCPAADPTTWDVHNVLQFYIEARALSYVNSAFIQDLENLGVGAYFSNGLPLP